MDVFGRVWVDVEPAYSKNSLLIGCELGIPPRRPVSGRLVAQPASPGSAAQPETTRKRPRTSARFAVTMTPETDPLSTLLGKVPVLARVSLEGLDGGLTLGGVFAEARTAPRRARLANTAVLGPNDAANRRQNRVSCCSQSMGMPLYNRAISPPFKRRRPSSSSRVSPGARKARGRTF